MKTVACIVVKSAKLFSFLGHMPVMNWSVAQLTEVRGVDRIVCVADQSLAPQARKLLARFDDIDVVPLPKNLAEARESVFDRWLSAADGPAYDADVVVVMKPTSPFLPAAKIEACVTAVARGKCTGCQPARPTSIINNSRKTAAKEAVESVRVFRVNAPAEKACLQTVPVSLLESLDVDQHDEYVMVDALVGAAKV